VTASTAGRLACGTELKSATAEAGMGEFTSEQIMQGIAAAIREQNFKVVPGLIKLLALQDPQQAQVLLESMKLVMDARGRKR